MWELDHKECWTLKNWCFQTVVWRRLLRVPWTTRRSNQSTLKEIRPEYSLAGLILKLNLQFFGHLMQRAYLLENTWIMEKIEGRRRRGRQRMRWLDGITDSMDMIFNKIWEGDSEGQGSPIHGVTNRDGRNWTTTTNMILIELLPKKEEDVIFRCFKKC